MKNIRNKRTFLKEKGNDTKVSNLVSESFKKFLKEAPEDEDIDLDAPENEEETNDEEIEGLDLENNEQVEAWVDELLGSTLEDETVNDSEIDLEDDADILNSDKTLRATEVPLSGNEMEDIIDADDSLEVLANELENISLESEDADLDELEDEVEDLEEAMLNEAIADLKKVANPTPGKKVSFAAGKNIRVKRPTITKKGDKEVVNVEDDFTVTENGDVEVNDKQVKDINKKNIAKAQSTDLKVSNLQLENYKLSKANSLLIVTADKLNEKARVSLVEGFNKCKTKEGVDSFYNKVIKTLKESAEKFNKTKTLKESVVKTKNVRTKLNEDASEKKEEKLSLKQQRINHLMGLNTKNDMYGNY